MSMLPDDLPDMTNEELKAAKDAPDIVVDSVQELAKLSPIEHDQVRENKAKELGVRVSTLDKEVAKARGDVAEDVAGDVVEELSPWPEPVDGESIGPMILHDIKAIFDDSGRAHIFSDDMVDQLVSLEERPWCEWRRGNPITKNTLSKLLRPFGIVSGTVRVGALTKKGYTRRNFKEAWSRYLLPPETAISNVTTTQSSDSKGLSPISKRHTDGNVTFLKTLKASGSAGCVVVTFQKGVFEKEEVKTGFPPSFQILLRGHWRRGLRFFSGAH